MRTKLSRVIGLVFALGCAAVAVSPLFAQGTPEGVTVTDGQAEIDPSPPVTERAETWWDRVKAVWDQNLFTVGETEIKVSQIVIAILVIVVGLVLSKLLTRILRNRLVHKFKLNASAALAVEKLAFYLLAIVVVLIGMQTVQIPVTVFTVMGGAVAIGVGFGAQNLFNNFISGLILLFERPIRLGDLIEVDGEIAEVREIAGRCTHVRRSDGVDVMVPNSILLENNVVNWTRRDRMIRTSVSVGVAYGSPTRRVAELIGEAVEAHDKVAQHPAPIILFTEFGDNALAFEVHFWAEVRQFMDLRVVRSDLRFAIDDLFREAGITIAFPQRDVHLDTIKPLEVKVVSDPEHR